MVQRASGKKFQEILNEAIVHPLNIEGEMYIGIPPGMVPFCLSYGYVLSRGASEF